MRLIPLIIHTLCGFLLTSQLAFSQNSGQKGDIQELLNELEGDKGIVSMSFPYEPSKLLVALKSNNVLSIYEELYKYKAMTRTNDKFLKIEKEIFNLLPRFIQDAQKPQSFSEDRLLDVINTLKIKEYKHQNKLISVSLPSLNIQRVVANFINVQKTNVLRDFFRSSFLKILEAGHNTKHSYYNQLFDLYDDDILKADYVSNFFLNFYEQNPESFNTVKFSSLYKSNVEFSDAYIKHFTKKVNQTDHLNRLLLDLKLSFQSKILMNQRCVEIMKRTSKIKPNSMEFYIIIKCYQDDLVKENIELYEDLTNRVFSLSSNRLPYLLMLTDKYLDNTQKEEIIERIFKLKDREFSSDLIAVMICVIDKGLSDFSKQKLKELILEIESRPHFDDKNILDLTIGYILLGDEELLIKSKLFNSDFSHPAFLTIFADRLKYTTTKPKQELEDEWRSYLAYPEVVPLNEDLPGLSQVYYHLALNSQFYEKAPQITLKKILKEKKYYTDIVLASKFGTKQELEEIVGLNLLDLFSNKSNAYSWPLGLEKGVENDSPLFRQILNTFSKKHLYFNKWALSFLKGEESSFEVEYLISSFPNKEFKDIIFSLSNNSDLFDLDLVKELSDNKILYNCLFANSRSELENVISYFSLLLKLKVNKSFRVNPYFNSFNNQRELTEKDREQIRNNFFKEAGNK